MKGVMVSKGRQQMTIFPALNFPNIEIYYSQINQSHHNKTVPKYHIINQPRHTKQMMCHNVIEYNGIRCWSIYRYMLYMLYATLCLQLIEGKNMIIIINYRNKRSMIFRSMLNKVLEGISNIGPVKNLIKYILDRSLNQLLSDQISLEDFKNGELQLTNISLNLDKINNQYLLSSPYILHVGNIRKLKIVLPGWTELSSKSIQLSAEGLQLDFKPNKQFADNFKNAMQEKQGDIIIQQAEQPGELKESNPMDFFRQLVKQIILNMKIKIENTVMRLFINQPTKEKNSKPQYFSMFRIPLLAIGKNQDKILMKLQDVQQIKFDLIIPQMSLHLLREGALFPYYSNQNAKEQDFPFLYPPVHHPSCILLIGKSSQNHDNSIKLTITLTTFFQKQKKVMAIQGKIGNVEMTIDPIQLKIISRFFAQLKQFQKVFQSVMIELGLKSEQNELNTLVKKDSKSKPSNDLLSSIMISMTDMSNLRNSVSKETEIYNSMMQVPQLASAANEFNQQAVDKLKNSGEFKEEGLTNINFKQESKTVFSLNNLQVNFLKYVAINCYENSWLGDIVNENVNENIGSSHFRLILKGLSYTFSSKENLHEAKMSYVKLHDVRLKNSVNYQFHHSVSEQFYDIQDSKYFKMSVKQDYFTFRPELLRFKLQKDQHYCLQELFRISQGQAPQVNNPKLRTYSFMPVGAICSQGAGLMVKFNGDSKTLKMDIKDVAVMVNFQIWKDVLNIIFPIFLYKRLAQRINIQSQQINLAEIKDKNFKFNELFQSQYKFTGKYTEELKSKEQKLQLRIKIGLIYCFYRETDILKSTKEDFLNQVEKKVLDSDNFSKECFCKVNQRAIYAEIHDFQFVKIQKQFNLTIEQIKAGLLSLQNSKIANSVTPILVCERLRVQQNRIQDKKEFNYSQGFSNIVMNTRVFIPSLNFSVQLPQLITFIDMVKKTITTIDSLQNFKKNLKSKLLFIEQELLNVQKAGKEKMKSQRIFQILIGEVELKMLLISTYCKNVFFRNKQDEKQIKFQCLAIGLINKMDLRLGQFQNVMQTEQYDYHKSSYKGIKDVNLLIEIGRQSKNKNKILLKSSSKAIRLEKKLTFFADLDKSHKEDAIFAPSLHLYMKEHLFSESQNRKSGSKFQFRKKPNEPARKNSVIEQEKHIKNIEIIPVQPIYIHLGNITFLFQLKNEIQETINQVKSVLDEISSESKDLIQRKNSQESQAENIFDISLRLQRCFINIDMKPDFSYKKETNQRILSNTRALLSTQIQTLTFLFNPDLSKSNITLSLNQEIYFLHYQDRSVELNPLLIYKHELEKQFGFKKIVSMNEVSIKVQAFFKDNIVNIQQFKVDSLGIEMSISTIPPLQLFLEHFLQHNLQANYGIGDQDWNFQLLQPEKKQDQVQDLTDKLQQLQIMIDKKSGCQKQFLNHEYSIKQNRSEGYLSVKKFRISKLKMKIYDADDFKFDQFDSLFESKSIQRIRSKIPQINKMIDLQLQKFDLRMQKTSAKTQVLLDFDKLELIFQFNRRESLLWGSNKLYSVTLLKIDSPLKILAHISKDYMQIKLNKLELTANMTDEIFQFVQMYTEKSNSINKSNWKKYYEHKKKEEGTGMVLFALPKGKITASVELKRAKLLNQINLKTKALLVHEQISNVEGIMKLVNDWCMNIFTQNVGKLVSGALFEVISAFVGLLLNGIKHFLSLFFPSLKQ